MSISNSTELLAYSLYALPLDQVHPRKVNAYAITDIERLAKSIQRSGLLQPVIVKKEAPDSYQLIAGERRFTAIKYLHEKYLSAGDTTKANLFNSIQAFVYENLPSEKEEQKEVAQECMRTHGFYNKSKEDWCMKSHKNQ